MKLASTQYLRDIYDKTGKELGLSNRSEYPKFVKIIIHIGTGKIRQDEKTVENITDNLQKITGQKPSFTSARKSVASFKVRKGEKIGLKTTIRGTKIDHFLIKLIKIVFPAIRDFKGISLSNFDKNANINVGIRDISVFPEISFQDQTGQTGLQVTIVPNTNNIESIKKLFANLGFPFKKS